MNYNVFKNSASEGLTKSSKAVDVSSSLISIASIILLVVIILGVTA